MWIIKNLKYKSKYVFDLYFWKSNNVFFYQYGITAGPAEIIEVNISLVFLYIKKERNVKFYLICG